MLKNQLKLFLLAIIGIFIASNIQAQTWEVGNVYLTFFDGSRGNRQIDTKVSYPADASGYNVPFGSPWDKRYPVIVMGHDEGIGIDKYEYIPGHLAVQGFIVIMPLTEMGAVMNVDEFAKDMAFVAKNVKDRRNDPTFFFYKRHNNMSCVMGHGKGGSAAVLAVQYYPGVTTMITMAANETPGVIAAASLVTVPSVVVAGGQDCVSPIGTVQEAIFNNLASDCKTLINYTTAPRCVFAMDDPNCVASQITCGGFNPYPWSVIGPTTTWYLVSFMRYYMKFNAPALAKFEWKLQQKTVDFLYVMSCNVNAPKIALNYDGNDNEFERVDFEEVPDVATLRVQTISNPVKEGTNAIINLDSEFDSQANVIITNMMGQIVSKEKIELNQRYNQLPVSTSHLSKGQYIVTISGLEGRTSKPLMIN